MIARTVEHYENKINLLKERGEIVNMRLIKKLQRRRKALEGKVAK